MKNITLDYLYDNSNCVFFDKNILHSGFNINETLYLSIYNQVKSIAKTDVIIIDLNAFSRATLCRVKRRLLKDGYIHNQSAEDTKQLVLSSKNTGTTCEWCGTKTIAIQQHHYPIPRNKGGAETVNICPNCHCEFHKLFGKGDENE